MWAEGETQFAHSPPSLPPSHPLQAPRNKRKFFFKKRGSWKCGIYGGVHTVLACIAEKEEEELIKKKGGGGRVKPLLHHPFVCRVEYFLPFFSVELHRRLILFFPVMRSWGIFSRTRIYCDEGDMRMRNIPTCFPQARLGQLSWNTLYVSLLINTVGVPKGLMMITRVWIFSPLHCFSPLNWSNCVLEIVSSSLPWGFPGTNAGRMRSSTQNGSHFKCVHGGGRTWWRKRWLSPPFLRRGNFRRGDKRWEINGGQICKKE